MRPLHIMEHISLDGVIQVTDDEGNFSYHDWTAPYRTVAGRERVTALYGTRFDLLLGRRTYDLWADFWPRAPSDAYSDSMNAATKYVVTHHPETLEWGPYEALRAPLVDSVRRIKAREGPALFLAGSSTLTSTLLEFGLVDELILAVYPVLLGAGKRLLAEGTPARTFARTHTHALQSGVTLDRYKLVGSVQ